MEQNAFQDSLFPSNDFHNPKYYVTDLPLVKNKLPELNETDIPRLDFHEWYNDGVPMFANSWEFVASSLTGIEEMSDISNDSLVHAYEEFLREGQLGKAMTVVRCADHLGSSQEDVTWQSRKIHSSILYIHRGLAEATLIPFADYDMESGELVVSTPMSLKDFLGVYTRVIDLAQAYPEQFDEYLEYADCLHMNMLLSYPKLGEYRHAMWKAWGTDKMNSYVLSAADRIKNSDEEWRVRVGDKFASRFEEVMDIHNFGRAGILATFGLKAAVMTDDFVFEQFLQAYEKLDLSKELQENVIAHGSIVVPYEYPDLTYLREMVGEISEDCPELGNRIESVTARREIETIQTLIEPASDTELTPNLRALLSEELASLAYKLPDEDQLKVDILTNDVLQDIETALSHFDKLMPTRIDDTVEKQIAARVLGLIDIDTLAINIDRLGSALISEIESLGINADTLERLMAFISPICRKGPEAIDQLITADIAIAIEETIKSRVNAYKSSETHKDHASYYMQLLNQLEDGGIYNLFDWYWQENEIYSG